jgi:hypothetical protein
MPKLLEVMGGTETKIYYQATVYRTCILVVPLTIKVGLTKFGNQAEALKHSEEFIFVTNLEQMFERRPPTLIQSGQRRSRD